MEKKKKKERGKSKGKHECIAQQIQEKVSLQQERGKKGNG